MSANDAIARIIEKGRCRGEWCGCPIGKSCAEHCDLLIADQIIATLRANGWHHDEDLVKGRTVEVIDESKFPTFRFKCPRGHGSWTEQQAPNHGRSQCKICQKETDGYNAMLKEKNYNWPVSFNHALHGVIIDKGSKYKSTRPATVADVLEGK